MSYPKRPLHDKVFKTLRDRIVYMEYPPGTSLLERELCKEFRVSRTPLREAIQKLKEMRLVDVIPRFGTYVSNVDINEIRCAFEVKIRLEGLAGSLAAKRITGDRLEEMNRIITEAQTLLDEKGHRALIEIDTRFHEIIYQATQNPILQGFLENLHGRCSRLWSSSLSEVIPNSEVIDQLKEVHVALKKRDSDRAAQVMEYHVQYFIDKIKLQLL